MWYTQFLDSTYLDPLEDHQEVGDNDVAAKLEVLEDVHGDYGSWHCRGRSYQLLSQMMNEMVWEALKCFFCYRESESSQIKMAKVEENIAKG